MIEALRNDSSSVMPEIFYQASKFLLFLFRTIEDFPFHYIDSCLLYTSGLLLRKPAVFGLHPRALTLTYLSSFLFREFLEEILIFNYTLQKISGYFFYPPSSSISRREMLIALKEICGVAY